MSKILVDGISFEFDDGWTVVKWDESPAFLEGIAKLHGPLSNDEQEARGVGSKAVDIVGVRDGALYLMEVKDFTRHKRPEDATMEKDREVEIAFKVRDTIAGVVGASRTRRHLWLDKYAELLLHPARDVIVVAWVEANEHHHAPLRRRGIRQMVQRDRLAQRLAWLTQKVSVASPFECRVPGVVASRLLA